MQSNFKTFFLLAFLTVLLVVAGRLIGGTQGAVIAFGLALIMNVISFWFSDKIVLKRYRAREVTREDNSGSTQLLNRLFSGRECQCQRSI